MQNFNKNPYRKSREQLLTGKNTDTHKQTDIPKSIRRKD